MEMLPDPATPMPSPTQPSCATPSGTLWPQNWGEVSGLSWHHLQETPGPRRLGGALWIQGLTDFPTLYASECHVVLGTRPGDRGRGFPGGCG